MCGCVWLCVIVCGCVWLYGCVWLSEQCRQISVQPHSTSTHPYPPTPVWPYDVGVVCKNDEKEEGAVRQRRGVLHVVVGEEI